MNDRRMDRKIFFVDSNVCVCSNYLFRKLFRFVVKQKKTVHSITPLTIINFFWFTITVGLRLNSTSSLRGGRVAMIYDGP